MKIHQIFKKSKCFKGDMKTTKKYIVSMRSFNREHIYVKVNTNASSAATTILATTAQPGTDQMLIEITKGKNISGLSLN